MPKKKKVAGPTEPEGGAVSAAPKPTVNSGVVDRLISKIGDRARLVRASEAYFPFSVRRPTGIAGLDMAMMGGWSAGTINQIFGPPGSCKTYLANETMANVQRIYGSEAKIAYASFGYGFDMQFARVFSGVTIPYSSDEVAVIREEAESEGRDLTEAEEEEISRSVGEFFFVEPSDWERPAESVLNGVLDVVRSAEFQLVVIDELNIGETRYGTVKELGEDPRTADLASLVTQFLKKFHNAIKQPSEKGVPNHTTVLEILEVRSTISTMSHGGLSQGGGHALKHAKAIDLHLKSWQDYKESDKIVGKHVEWHIDKGKMGVREGGSGSFVFRHGYGADKEMDLIVMAEQAGLVVKTGATWSFTNEAKEKLGVGLGAAARWLRKNPEVRDGLKKAVFAAAGVKVR